MLRRGAATLAIASLALMGCGGGDGEELTVSAAASLTDAFEAYGEELDGDQRFSFAGSDELAAQLRQGAQPDVFASANTAYPDELAADGLVEEPVTFARNELVVAVAEGSGLDSVSELADPGLDLVIAAEGVPVGDYTRELLGRLPAGRRDAILANVRSEESDVKGVLGKIAAGAADAGFVYSSDIAAVGGEVGEVRIPARLDPDVAYAVAVVDGAPNREGATEFIEGLLEGAGARALAESGLLPPR